MRHSSPPTASSPAAWSPPVPATITGRLGLTLRARAYNALLQGQFRDSAQTISAGDLEPLIAEAWLGYSRVFQRGGIGWQLSYTLRAQSPELRDGPGRRGYAWAQIALSCTWW